MNKKFTMVCASLLLTSAFTVNAQNAPVSFDQNSLISTEEIKGLPAGHGEDLYHLVASKDPQVGIVDNEVLSLSQNGDIQLVNLNVQPFGVETASENWASSLWCVNVADLENNGQNPTFDFTNTLRGMMLDVTVEGYNDKTNTNWTGNLISEDNTSVRYSKLVAKVGGEVSGWKFSPIYKTGVKDECYLGSYVAPDVMAVLVFDKTAGHISVAVTKADDVENRVNGLLKFSLKKPVDKVLTADEFNSILYTKEMKDGKYAPVQLTFNQDANHPDFPNVFSQTAINAEAIPGEAFVRLYSLDDAGKKHYLHVDTAYTNDKGIRFLKLNKTKLNEDGTEHVFGTGGNNGNLANLQDLGKFAVYYDAAKKEVFIRAKRVYHKLDGETAKYWRSINTSTEGADVAVDNNLTAVDKTNWVKLQNLVGGEYRIITIGDSPVNTKVSFGFGACDVVASNKTSVADGVYVFYDKAGNVLGMPIHENGQMAPKWVKLDTQDPQHMPAYQWVVLKNQTDDKYAPTSKIKLTNREFPQWTATVQLIKDEKGNVTTDNGAVTFQNGGTSSQSLEVEYFSNIKPVSNISDPYMGYRYLDKDSLTVTAYGFNYLHPFSQSTWIESNKDGVLKVAETTAPERFTLKVSKNSTPTTYGFEVTDKVKARIKGLAQLKRISYSIESSNTYLTEGEGNQHDKYVLKEKAANVSEVDSFFLKENNHYEAEHYFALVRSSYNGDKQDVNARRYIADKDYANKVGVADDGMSADLKVQLLNETRTSAFAVKVMDAPLYRRFNNPELEGGEAGDVTKTLRFFEKYRNEYLQMEANPSFIVDKNVKYLGIDDADKSETGLAFQVDTAWVNRGLGYIKPQYLISIDRDDIEAVPGKPCDATNHKHFDNEGNPTDEWGCSHATPAKPAMNFGWYLVNFQDSVDYNKADVAKAYQWAGYTRAGFVKAIQYKDSLYILKDEFKDVEKKDINTELIEKIIKANKVKVAKEEAPYIVDLAGDEHKYATWSMRYINPGSEDQSFLIESMKNKVTNQPDIAPEMAAWLKMQNGCLVLSKYDSKFTDAKTGGDDALVFDVVKGDDLATENEAIATTEVAVIAQNGAVVVKNAAGKNVVVSTILGQIVANEVLTSDNATVNVPAGIVVVSVDGESFKVNVK